MDWINSQTNNRYVTMGRIPVVNSEVTIPDPNSTLLFAITLEDENSFAYIGTATLHNIDWISRKAEVGYMIGNQSQWGKGYATEVVRLLADYGFNRLNLYKLSADVVVENKASQRVLEKNGFVSWGTSPDDFYLEGKYLDNIMYYKLRSM